MKAIRNSVTNLVNSYACAISYKEKSEVNNLARSVLSQVDLLKYIDRCIAIEKYELVLLESELGLSGVQNEDNL